MKPWFLKRDESILLRRQDMRTLAMILLFAANSFAQNPGMTARPVYLQTDPPTPGGSQPQARSKGKSKSPPVERSSPPQESIVKPPRSPDTSTAVPVALHLVLRYKVLRVEPKR